MTQPTQVCFFHRVAINDVATTQSVVGSNCASVDYISVCCLKQHTIWGMINAMNSLQIPGATTAAQAMATATITTVNRICGRDFTHTAAMDSDTVCTRSIPFRVGFYSNDYELATAALATAIINEADFVAAGSDPGILGFKLIFWQGSC